MTAMETKRSLCTILRRDFPIVNNQQVIAIEQQMNASNQTYVDITGVTYLGYHKIEEGM